jgi:hypothetical protein
MSFAYDDDESNPFADPSVRQHTRPANTGGYDYGGTAREVPTQPARPTQPSAYQQPSQPPAYMPSQPHINNDDLLRRQEELDRKADELQRKEQELKNQAAAASGVRENNFPPLPSFVPVKPCFYQNFDLDIPAEFRRIVQLLYYLWLFYILSLLYNLVAGISYYIMVKDATIETAGMPVIYLLLFTPCAYTCWFRAAYNAFKADSSFNFFLFFFTFFCQFCVCCMFAVGPTSYGMMGWWTLIDAFQDSTVCGIIVLVSAIAFTVEAIGMGILLQRVHSLYRTTDASFTKAQAEFSTNMMSNQTVQRAAAATATSAARNTFSGGNS